MRPVALLAAMTLVLAGCNSLFTSATPQPPVLYLENRGGPAYAVTIDGTDVGIVTCDSTVQIVPGEANVPPLPWDLTLMRLRDKAIILSSHVVGLPLWFSQIGDEPDRALSARPVAASPGPTCPPAA